MQINHWVDYKIGRIKRRITGFCLLIALLLLVGCGGICGLSGLSIALLHL